MSTLTLDSVRVSFSCFLLDISGVLRTRNTSMFIVKHLFSRDWEGLLHQNTLLSWAGLARQICCGNSYLIYSKVHAWSFTLSGALGPEKPVMDSSSASSWLWDLGQVTLPLWASIWWIEWYLGDNAVALWGSTEDGRLTMWLWSQTGWGLNPLFTTSLIRGKV